MPAPRPIKAVWPVMDVSKLLSVIGERATEITITPNTAITIAAVAPMLKSTPKKNKKLQSTSVQFGNNHFYV